MNGPYIQLSATCPFTNVVYSFIVIVDIFFENVLIHMAYAIGNCVDVALRGRGRQAIQLLFH